MLAVAVDMILLCSVVVESKVSLLVRVLSSCVPGAVYLGALLALEEAGILQNVKNIAGTSAGSLTAALLSVGFTSCELRDELHAVSFDQLVGAF